MPFRPVDWSEAVLGVFKDASQMVDSPPAEQPLAQRATRSATVRGSSRSVGSRVNASKSSMDASLLGRMTTRPAATIVATDRSVSRAEPDIDCACSTSIPHAETRGGSEGSPADVSGFEHSASARKGAANWLPGAPGLPWEPQPTGREIDYTLTGVCQIVQGPNTGTWRMSDGKLAREMGNVWSIVPGRTSDQPFETLDETPGVECPETGSSSPGYLGNYAWFNNIPSWFNDSFPQLAQSLRPGVDNMGFDWIYAQVSDPRA